jgi:hypothetical protein
MKLLLSRSLFQQAIGFRKFIQKRGRAGIGEKTIL